MPPRSAIGATQSTARAAIDAVGYEDSPGGDLDGTYRTPSVVALRGRAVSATPPNAGEGLFWGGAEWSPSAVPPGPPPSYAYWIFVEAAGDFPAAVGGVITLAANTTYVVTTTVDLAGDRLVAGENTTIIGGSSENCRLKSTGLVGLPLVTSQWSLPMRNVAIEADVAFDLDGAGNPGVALDWFGVNLTDCGSAGTIKDYNNVIWTDCALLNTGGLRFDGTLNTVGFNSCLFSVPAGEAGITIEATATIARRFRVIYSSLIVPPTATGIAVPVLAAFPLSESLILDTVNFSGGGTYLDGVSQADNAALIVNAVGIENSASVAQYYMTGNVAVTSTTLQGAFYKVAGATTPGPYVSKFTLSDNRATYSGARASFFHVTATASLTDGNNQDIALRLAVGGATIVASTSKVNTGAGGRVENVTVQATVLLSLGSYVELWAANTTSAGGSLVVTDMNVSIVRAV